MPVIATMNYKGGVGKTTTTANIAAELAYRNKNVLLLDLDPQASLTFSFVTPEDWQYKLKDKRTIKAWFESQESSEPISLEDLIIEPKKASQVIRDLNGTGHIRLISSHLGLLNVDLELATQLGGASPEQNAKNYLKVHDQLRIGLKSILDDYDVVLMDCPPNFNITTKAAIVASDYVLVPAKPDYLSTLGIDFLIRNLDELKRIFNFYADQSSVTKIDPQILGVVFTMVQVYGGQPITSQRQYINQVKQLDVPVMNRWIRTNNTQYAEAPQYGVPVVLESDYAQSREEFEELVSELERLLNVL